MSPSVHDMNGGRRRRFEDGLSASQEVSIINEIKALQPGAQFMEIKPGQWKPAKDDYGLPPHCPVTPLGRDDDICYVLNTFGTVSTLTANNSKKGQLQMIFGNLTQYAVWAWPRLNAKRSTKENPYFEDNFDADAAARALIEACTEKSNRFGAWDQVDKVRGRGIWLDDEGRVIAHLGDRVLIGGKDVRQPSEIGGYLYPKRTSIAMPAATRPVGGDGGPGVELLQILREWNWSRPDLDPQLLLGWIGQAFLSGALNWRSVAYITGGFGTGKSTLLKVIDSVLGGFAFKAEDATAPAIYRALKNDAGAVILDENEAAEDDRKGRGLLELARKAASGADVYRANQAGGASEFRAMGSFIFASINPPGLESQDFSRMAILALRPLEKLKSRADWGDKPFLEELGRQLLRRLIDDFPRIERLIQEFRSRLVLTGHKGRGGDTFGTLAAIGHVMMYDDDPDAALLDEWASRLAPTALSELELATDGWVDCLDQLLNAQPDPFRNKAHTSVGALLDAYRRDEITIDPDMKTSVETKLKRALALVGLGLIQPKTGAFGFKTAELFVPASHPAATQLFDGTKWAGRGVYIGSLRQAPRTMWRPVKGQVGLQKKSGIAIALTELVKGDDDDETSNE